MKSVYNTKDITTPKSGLEVYKDKFWLCEGGDPKKALFYGASPQCNSDKRIQERALALSPVNTQIVFMETAFVPQRN